MGGRTGMGMGRSERGTGGMGTWRMENRGKVSKRFTTDETIFSEEFSLNQSELFILERASLLEFQAFP